MAEGGYQAWFDAAQPMIAFRDRFAGPRAVLDIKIGEDSEVDVVALQAWVRRALAELGVTKGTKLVGSSCLAEDGVGTTMEITLWSDR
jgi:hypothetical protein